MTINVITSHDWLGNLERDTVARECGFCGEEIPPRAWMTVSRRQPDDGQYRKPLRVCIACSDVIAWAGEAGWEEALSLAIGGPRIPGAPRRESRQRMEGQP